MAGSPPRMRGKEGKKYYEELGIRITPAYAGKREFPDDSNGGAKDHPRVCGEKRYEEQRLGINRGSPPRMRGKGPGHRW